MVKAFVGGDCYHTILNHIFKTKFWFFFMPNIGAMAISPYRFLNIKSLSARFHFIPMLLNGALENSTLQKHYNLSYFSQKLFFNVKILKIV